MWKRLKTISSPPPSDIRLDLGERHVIVRVTYRAQSKRMTLRLTRQRDIVALSLPLYTSVTKGMDWVETKKDWIEEHMRGRPPILPIKPGMRVPIGDESLLLDWSADYPRAIKRFEDRIQIGGPQNLIAQRLMRWLRAEAKAVLTAETQLYAGHAGVIVSNVTVGDPITRWGSCSEEGAIRYSWRLILAPQAVRVATVAHEVAHRVHMNHSREFHALVAKILGYDPKSERHWLRDRGAELHGFGAGS